MKKLGWIAVLTMFAAGIMFFLTRAKNRLDTRSDFNRIYSTNTVRISGTFAAPFNVDILSAWKNTIIGYGLRSKRLFQFDTAGHILQQYDFSGHGEFGLHSMSYDSNYLYCIDLNGHSVYTTNFTDSLSLADTLPHNLMGCVKSPWPGYIVHQFGNATKSAVMKSLHASQEDTLYSFTSFNDWGISHRGVLFQNVNASYFIYLPSFNAHGLVYEYATNKLSPIVTIDNNPVADRSVDGPQGRVLSTKASVVNRIAAANEKYLFVLSYARSFEDREKGIDQPVVDVYALNDRSYKSSFLVPGIKGMRISGFTCLRDKLVVSLDHKVTLLDVSFFN